MISEILTCVWNTDYLPYLLTIIVSVFWIINYQCRNKNLPPGPIGYPFIGSIGQLASGNQLQTFRRLRSEYGDIFSLKLGTKLYIVFNGYDTLRETFVKHGDIFSNRPNTYMMKLISRDRGLSGSSGEVWKKTRTFTISALRDFGFGRRTLEHKIVEEVKAFMTVLENCQGQPIDIRNTSLTSIANIVCSIVFGERFGYDDKHFNRLLDLLDRNFKLAGLTGMLSFFPFLRFLPGDKFRVKELINNITEIREFFVEQIEHHKEMFDGEDTKDFIDAFLVEQQGVGKQQDDVYSKIFTELNLTTLIGNLFSAGTETTSTAIRWAIIYLLRDKQVQDSLRTEVDSVVGLSRLPSLNDRQNMPYSEAFILEVLRHSNIAPLAIPRGVSENTTISGYHIPKEAVLIPNLDSVLSDPEIFPNPASFDPTRFIGEDGKLSGYDKVIAFSIGRRSCPGESLARMELFLYVTTLVQKFSLEVDQDVPSLDGELGITYCPKPFTFKGIKRNETS